MDLEILTRINQIGIVEDTNLIRLLKLHNSLETYFYSYTCFRLVIKLHFTFFELIL